jgi:uncharacterized membrane protein
MAAILQLRRGALTDFSSYGTNVSEPYFDTIRDTIQIGTTDGTGSDADWITLVKLSQANRDYTKSEPNTGSLWIVGDITASGVPNVQDGLYDSLNNTDGYSLDSGQLTSTLHPTSSFYLNGNFTASHAWFRRDVRIDGHLIMGDNREIDVIDVRSDFSGSLLPDNDLYSSSLSTPQTGYFDLGSNSKRWKNIYLTKDSTNDGFISASNADFTGKVKIDGTLETDGQATLASANIEDLTNNRIVIVGIDGELEDDENFTFDGDEFNIGLGQFTVRRDNGNTFTSGTLHTDGQATLASANVEDLTETRIVFAGANGEIEDSEDLTFDKSNSNFRLIGDYYQSGSGASFQFVGAGGEVTGSWTISELAIDNGIVFTNAEGTVDNSSDFTWDGDFVNIVGGVTASQDLTVNRAAYLASAKVEDLTEDRIVIAGNRGEIEDDQYFRFTGANFIVGDLERFRVQVSNGNTFISGAVQMFSTLDVDSQSTLASVNVEDLTDNRVVIVGAGGEIEDDGNFTFDGTELNIGTGNFTVQQGSGNTQILGTLDVDSQSTLSSLNVQDLTDNRIVIVGTSGEIEDDANLTFNGTELNIGTGNFTVQQGSGNTQILGILDVDSQSTLSSVNVQDLTSGRVVLAGTSGEIEDSGNLTFNGSLLTVTGDTIITGDLTVQGDTTQLNVSTLNVEDKNILIASGAADASAANGGGITIDGADATILYSSGNDSFQLNKQLQVEGNISGSSFGGTTLLSSSNENFADYSQSVDTRLDSIEGPMSTSLDSRLIEIFATGSDHETRLDAQELHSSSFTSNDLDMNGNKVLFGNVYSAEGDLPAAGTYHGMFAHVHGTGKGYFAHGGNWIPLLNESTFTTDSASFDSRLDAQESFSTSLDDTFATEAEVNSATSSLSSSLAVDIASNLSEITNLNSFSSSIETYLPTGTISGSSQVDVEYDMLDSSFTARAANVTLSSGTTSAIIDFTSSAVFEITTPTDSTATTLNFDNAEIGMSKMILIVNQSTAGSGTITLGQTTGTGTFIRTSSDDIVRTLSTTNYLQITCIAASGDDRTFVYTVGTAQ